MRTFVKRTASLFLALLMMVSLGCATALADDDTTCDIDGKIEGTASGTVEFKVKTKSRLFGWKSYVNLEQTYGCGLYENADTHVAEEFTFSETGSPYRESKIYGLYSIEVYDSENNLVSIPADEATWNCTKTHKIHLDNNKTYTIKVIPDSVSNVFCSYGEKHPVLNFKYRKACFTASACSWKTVPEWNVKSTAGIKKLSNICE